MNFILKIVQGPNAGAEIALVEGVAVTLGKSDDCDIVLADATLPDEPVSIEASASGVTAGGAPLEPFHVRVLGSTAFAAGPASGAWGELVWPKAEEPKPETPAPGDAPEPSPAPAGGDSAPPADGAPDADGGKPEKKKRRGCAAGCLAAAALCVLAAILAMLFFRDSAKALAQRLRGSVSGDGAEESAGGPRPGEDPRKAALSAVAAKYGLSMKEEGGRYTLSGDFKTRAERLAASAEAFEAMPGADVDFSDDESFCSAATDALLILSEGSLKVVSATNRFLAIGGLSRSPGALSRTLSALDADLPKLRGVDVSRVAFDAKAKDATAPEPETAVQTPVYGTAPAAKKIQPRKKKDTHSLPVCGILSVPYPCLVMRDGRRVMEGAPLEGYVVEKIGQDSVTLTNAAGRVEWKP